MGRIRVQLNCIQQGVSSIFTIWTQFGQVQRQDIWISIQINNAIATSWWRMLDLSDNQLKFQRMYPNIWKTRSYNSMSAKQWLKLKSWLQAHENVNTAWASGDVGDLKQFCAAVLGKQWSRMIIWYLQSDENNCVPASWTKRQVQNVLARSGVMCCPNRWPQFQPPQLANRTRAHTSTECAPPSPAIYKPQHSGCCLICRIQWFLECSRLRMMKPKLELHWRRNWKDEWTGREVALSWI